MGTDSVAVGEVPATAPTQTDEESRKAAYHGVLLVPEEGDPLGLLDEGPCGFRPPFAYWHTHSTGDSWCFGGHLLDGMGAYRCALVLVWDGNASEVGCFLLEGWGGLNLWVTLDLFLSGPQDASEVEELLAHMETPVGRVVLVDANGREVAP